MRLRWTHLAVLCALWAPLGYAGTTITFDFQAGFNDATTTTPVGGNTGTTLGEQRRILFQAAADVWGAVIDSPVPIEVQAQFSGLQCDSGGAVLGQAGPLSGSFPQLMGGNVAYPVALAQALIGSNQFPGNPDIISTFNSNIDDGCGPFTGFYYGLDNNPGPGQPALFATVLHELGHGLGFSSRIEEDGSLLSDLPSIFDVFLFDVEADDFLLDLTAPARSQSILNDPDLVWDGINVTNAAPGVVNQGLNAGSLRMHAPGTYEPGSSVSHFSTAASPDLLMEPILTPSLAFGETDLTPALFQDLGYAINVVNSGLIFLSSFEAGE